MMIGKGEYNKQWCLSELQQSNIILRKDDNVALLNDYLNTYTKSEIEEGVDTRYDVGCCRVPGGLERKQISKSENCIYTPKYTYPTYSQKITYFLKRFK